MILRKHTRTQFNMMYSIYDKKCIVKVIKIGVLTICCL